MKHLSGSTVPDRCIEYSMPVRISPACIGPYIGLILQETIKHVWLSGDFQCPAIPHPFDTSTFLTTLKTKPPDQNKSNTLDVTSLKKELINYTGCIQPMNSDFTRFIEISDTPLMVVAGKCCLWTARLDVLISVSQPLSILHGIELLDNLSAQMRISLFFQNVNKVVPS